MKFKTIKQCGFLIDCIPILVKVDEDKEPIIDVKGEIVEIDNDAKITYGQVKDMFAQLIENLKQDLKDLVNMIPGGEK